MDELATWLGGEGEGLFGGLLGGLCGLLSKGCTIRGTHVKCLGHIAREHAGEHIVLCETGKCICQAPRHCLTWFGEFGGLPAGLGLLGLGLLGLGLLGLGLLGLGLLGGELELPRAKAGEFLHSKIPAHGQSSTCLHTGAPSSSSWTSMMRTSLADHFRGPALSPAAEQASCQGCCNCNQAAA